MLIASLILGSEDTTPSSCGLQGEEEEEEEEKKEEDRRGIRIKAWRWRGEKREVKKREREREKGKIRESREGERHGSRAKRGGLTCARVCLGGQPMPPTYASFSLSSTTNNRSIISARGLLLAYFGRSLSPLSLFFFLFFFTTWLTQLFLATLYTYQMVERITLRKSCD